MSQTHIPTARVQKHGFIADLFLSKHSTGSIFHYVILRDGSAEVLFAGQEHSFKEALNRIEEYLFELRNRSLSA